ncbi:hypothetical protein KGY77_04485 [Candidatus Bipolaricaulota bacterium]|nr:hypothetical protein [Candidatus Bipolaricaulota bacterium]
MLSNSIRRLNIPADTASFIIVLVLGVISLVPLPALSISLPDKIGRLNDYGNVLTIEDQRTLKEKITQLEDEEIGLNLLVSTRDPYLNPDIFASKIRAKWGIREERNENFIVFVREEGSWAVRTFFTTSLLNLFSAEGLKDYQERLRKKASSGEIRTGTIYAVNTVYSKAFPPNKEETNQPAEEAEGLPLLYTIIGGTAGGIILLTVLIRWEAMRRCPHCGSRLTISRVNDEFTEETIKNCPECGYSESE